MLTQFYKEMQAWVDAGLPKVSFFSKSFGLCTNLRCFCWKQFEPSISPDKHQECADKHQECAEALRKQFLDEHLDTDYPFNVSASEFVCETEQDTKYTNPKRLEWIKRHATT